MNRQNLIEEIDSMLAEGVQANRKAHLQIQEVMNHFRRQEAGKAQPHNGKAVAQIPNQQPKSQEDK